MRQFEINEISDQAFHLLGDNWFFLLLFTLWIRLKTSKARLELRSKPKWVDDEAMFRVVASSDHPPGQLGQP